MKAHLETNSAQSWPVSSLWADLPMDSFGSNPFWKLQTMLTQWFRNRRIGNILRRLSSSSQCEKIRNRPPSGIRDRPYSASYDTHNVHPGDGIHLYVVPAIYGPSEFFRRSNLHDNLQLPSLLTIVRLIKLDQVLRASIASFRQIWTSHLVPLLTLSTAIINGTE